MAMETPAFPIGNRPSRLVNRIAPAAVTVLLIGGLLVPGGEKTIAYPAAVVCAPLILATVLRRLPRLHWIMVFDILVFGSLGLFSLVTPAPSSQYAVQKLSYFMSLTLLSASAACLFASESRITRLARTWVLGACYLAVITVVSASLGERAAPFNSNPIWLGRVFSAGIVMLVWLWLSRRLQLSWAILSAGLLLAGLFASGSRGPLLAAAVGVVILLVLGGHGWRSLAITSGATGAVALMMQLPLFQQSRIISFAPGAILTDFSRSAMLGSTVNLIRQHPFGVGIGNWSDYSMFSRAFKYPHNLFLEAAAELGVIAGVLFALFVVLILTTSLRRSWQDHSLRLPSAWLAVEIIHVSVSGDLNARTFFFVLALTFLTMIRQRNHQLGANQIQPSLAIPEGQPSLPPYHLSA
jgi:O-antigen ligase